MVIVTIPILHYVWCSVPCFIVDCHVIIVVVVLVMVVISVFMMDALRRRGCTLYTRGCAYNTNFTTATAFVEDGM